MKLTSAIERVDVLLSRGRLLLHAIPDLAFTGLVVCAVAARDELLVLSTASDREPSLEVELFGSSVV